jgi:hypothetical protein
VAEILAIHAEHHGAYGAPRVHAELRARGRKINRKRVATSSAGISGARSAPRSRTGRLRPCRTW